VNLIAIDPGKTTGWALFYKGPLYSAGVCSRDQFFKGLPLAGPSYSVVIENPRWYPHDYTDVNDLLDLAVLVGEIKQHYAIRDAAVELVWPRTWKGNAPKNMMTKRILSRLTPEELAVVPVRPRARTVDHNAADAIGLGLWKLGRLR
jgi:hypothetical protein